MSRRMPRRMRGPSSPVPTAGWPPKGFRPAERLRARKARPYAETEGHPVGGPGPAPEWRPGAEIPGNFLDGPEKGDILLENDPLPKVGNGGFCRVCNFHIFLFGGRYETFERHLEQCAGVRPAAGRYGQRPSSWPLSRGPVRAVGGSPRAHFAAGVYARTGRPVVLVCADEGEGERLARDLESLTGQRCRCSPPGPTSFTTRPLSPASGSTGGWP